MSLWKKAAGGVATTTLLASLLATVAATGAYAAVGSTSVTGGGSIAPGQTSTAVSMTFNEGTTATLDCTFNVGGGAIAVRIYDALGADTLQFKGTPAISGNPGSLTGGATSLSSAGTGTNNVLNVSFTGSDTTAAEPFTITGLTIKATTSAAAGAALMDVTTNTLSVSGNRSCFGQGNVTVSAVTGPAAVVAGDTSVPFTGETNGLADFVTSGAITPAGGVAGSASALSISDSPNSENVGIVTGAAGPAGTLTTNALTFGHAAGTDISQSVPVAGLLASPVTVVNGLVEDTANAAPIETVQPGETNQDAGGVNVTETAAGALAKNSVVTFKLDTTGVVFSAAPWVWVTNGDISLGANPVSCSLSFDRTSCSVTVTAASTVASTLQLSGTSTNNDDPISIDLGAVAQGTTVGVTVTTSPAVPVVVTDNAIAYVGRVVVGNASTPSVYINENDQPSGLITLTEQAPGFFQDASVNTGRNWVWVCVTTAGTTFTRAPFAVVTTGDLKLRNGAAAATSVQMTLSTNNTCAFVQVWSMSTVASTIEIRGSDASNAVLPSAPGNGPRISLSSSVKPGAILFSVGTATDSTGANPQTLSSFTNAVAMYRNQPAIAAVSAPTIPAGSVDSTLGNITITETQAGQLKAGETICVELLPRTSITSQTAVNDVFFATANSNQNPVISTNTASGLLATRGGFGCGETDVTDVFTSFAVTVNQQATGSLGTITISNMHVITAANAAAGPILVRVVRTGGPGQDFEGVVSNGTIGTVVSTITWKTGTALGNTKTGPFTASTKIAHHGGYITWQFDGGTVAANQTIQIWAYKKTSLTGKWSAAYLLTTRKTSATGVAYANIRSYSSSLWLSIRPVLGTNWGPTSIGRWIR